MKKILFFFMLMLLCVSTSCTKDEIKKPIEPPIVETYSVTFDSNGGSEVPAQAIKKGETAYEPKSPQKEGCVFAGWLYEDSSFDFSTKINKDITLVAQWETEFDDYGMNVIEIKLIEVSISQDGLYTSMIEVGTYIYTYHRLPQNYKTKSEFKKANHTFENKLSVGGDTFQNRERLLPYKAGRTYKECDIDYNGSSRNAKRIVFSSDDLIFYTEDHYDSFSILRFL